MRTRLALLAGLVLLVIAPAAPAQPGAGEDAALLALVDRWTAARNANDALAMRPLFDDGMDQVDMGEWEVVATSGDGSVRWCADVFRRGNGVRSTASVRDRRARVIDEGTGVVDYTFDLARADGVPYARTTASFFCRRRAGAWKVVALRFTSQDPPK